MSERFSIIGLMPAAGRLLVSVRGKMFHELCGPADENTLSASASSAALWPAVARMVVADVPMSLDQGLAIAGAARRGFVVLAIGPIVSVLLMATGSRQTVGRLPWIAWLGRLIVVFVAFDMIWRGIYEIEPHRMEWSGGRPCRPNWRTVRLKGLFPAVAPRRPNRRSPPG